MTFSELEYAKSKEAIHIRIEEINKERYALQARERNLDFHRMAYQDITYAALVYLIRLLRRCGVVLHFYREGMMIEFPVKSIIKLLFSPGSERYQPLSDGEQETLGNIIEGVGILEKMERKRRKTVL